VAQFACLILGTEAGKQIPLEWFSRAPSCGIFSTVASEAYNFLYEGSELS
jgi:hypothetical protein